MALDPDKSVEAGATSPSDCMKNPTLFDIARLAYERGFLDLRHLLDAVYEAGRAGDAARQPGFWISPERLTAQQLRQLVQGEVDTQPASLPPSSAGASLTITLSDDLEPSPPPRVVAPPPPPPPPPPRRETQRPPPPTPTVAPPPPAGTGRGDTRERYKVIGELGTGGMGRVIEVEDERLGRRVAVKSLRPDLPDKELPARLLEREASLTGGLEHPNIVPVYDAGHDPSLGPYYVMRVLKQPSLLHVLSKLRKGEPDAAADYTLGKLLRLFVQVCHAVDYANARGIVHCDLKPANILLGSFGEVLVVDWGFAQRIGEQSPVHGGTPGYMAPEQLDPTPGRLDGRADVFALGTILYELLTLRKAFPSPSVEAMIAAIQNNEPPLKLPPRPRTLAPGRVAEELDEICMRALALAPAQRFATARAMADELETFLEGTKEKERRLARASEMTEQGDDLAGSYGEMLASRPERAAEINDLLRTIEPWQDAEQKQSLWDAEDRRSVLDSLAIRTFQSAVSAYEHALDELPGHPPARRGLASLYLKEAERARQRRDDFNRIYFEGLVQQFDDDALTERAAQSGALTLTSEPAGLMAEIQILTEQGRRLVTTTELPPERTPLHLKGLEPGHYLLLVDDPQGPSVRYPLLVRPGATGQSAHIDLNEARQVHEGEVFVPGGPALLGGHESSALGLEPVEIEVPSFFLSTAPVSFAEFLEFLGDLFVSDPATAERLLPATSDGAPYWEWDGEDFVPAQVALWGESPVELLCLPAVGVSFEGAVLFARWRAEQTGLPYRLPTEFEWEKAARGTDGRLFPWGDHFDASFCKMRQSRPGPPLPEPPGMFPHDVSPYGARDMAGGVGEWVLHGDGLTLPSDLSHVVTRGGAWCDWSSSCHAAARHTYWATERSERVGFRLARYPGRLGDSQR